MGVGWLRSAARAHRCACVLAPRRAAAGGDAVTALNITVPVPPGEVAVNRRYCKSGVLARRWRAGRDEIVMHLRQAWRKEPIAGPVRVELHAHWPTAAGDRSEEH